MAYKDDVVARWRHRPVGLVGDANRVQLTSAVKGQRLGKIEELRLDSTD
jgi:hypothetical protein